MFKNFTSIIFLLGLQLLAMSQTSSIKGRIFNSINNEPIPFANVIIDSSTVGTASDIDGNFEIKNLTPGEYTVTCSTIGFERAIFYEVIVNPVKSTTLNIALVETANNLKAVEIKATPFQRNEESPLSMRTINAAEIYRNPGGNRDISKVIQILPGVGSSAGFRNDIIVRGGAPSENRFFLDGIEVPNINHFATQGSSGGPVGMINVNFIQEVDFLAGAFPANRGNSLSSVMNFTQIEGNKDKLTGTFMVGSSDIGLTLNGPMGKKSSFIFSARRSYLGFLFKALKLPFLPTYNDFQYKHTIRFNKKNTLNIVGLAAIDDFELNESVNEGETDPEVIERNEYTLNNLPINTQWNYTIGGNLTHFEKKSFQNYIVSRNVLNNKAKKYRDNIETPENLILLYESRETENKFRFEHTYRNKGWKLNVGTGIQNVQYYNSTYNQTVIDGLVREIDFTSNLSFEKFSLFGQLSKSVLENRLALSFGLRTDFNNFSDEMANPLDQLSPRFSASYSLTTKWNVNFNVGRYFQLPAYTVMGYRNSAGDLVNKNNGITYISSDHIVAGLEYSPKKSTKVTIEGFHKWYGGYPFTLGDSISLANLGGDFGVIGNEPVVSYGKGKAYGLEFFVQQKLTSSIYGILSYTYVRSEFTDKNNVYVPSSWDNQHILNITAGKKFKGNWELGAKFRLLGGAPYTPYNIPTSALKVNWDVTQSGIPDYNRLNTNRLPLSHGLDVRVDKKWFYKKLAINVYLDIQNIYNFRALGQPILDVQRDDLGNPITNPNKPDSYLVREIQNENGTLLPSIGLQVDF
ncbi:MAG: TonB-dependent receptor [Salibacteraceae bacterium]